MDEIIIELKYIDEIKLKIKIMQNEWYGPKYQIDVEWLEWKKYIYSYVIDIWTEWDQDCIQIELSSYILIIKL